MRITGPDYATVGVAIVTAPEDYKGAGTGYAGARTGVVSSAMSGTRW